MSTRQPPDSKWRPLKDFLLLVAGALGGLSTTLIFQPQPNATFIAISVAAFFLSAAYGLSLIDRLCRTVTKAVRDYRGRHRPVVGVLSDMNWEEDRQGIASWANVTSGQWLSILRANSVGYRSAMYPVSVTFGSNFDRLNVIVNPYGGVYPEEDTISLKNLNTIFDWVSEGGLFVNVADLPGYWMYHTYMKTKVDATPTVYAFIMQDNKPVLTSARPFEKTPFAERLSIRIHNIKGIDTATFHLKCTDTTLPLDRFSSLMTERLAVVEKNVQPIITYHRAQTTEVLTPLFWVPYGRGCFLFSLYFLDDNYPQNESLPVILADIVQRRMADNLATTVDRKNRGG